MKFWPFRRAPKPQPDINQFLAELDVAPPADYPPDAWWQDFRAVLQTGGATEMQARRVLWRLLEWGHLFHTSMALTGKQGEIGPVDPLQTAFREGERSIALKILTVLQLRPVRPAPRLGETDG